MNIQDRGVPFSATNNSLLNPTPGYAMAGGTLSVIIGSPVQGKEYFITDLSIINTGDPRFASNGTFGVYYTTSTGSSTALAGATGSTTALWQGVVVSNGSMSGIWQEDFMTPLRVGMNNGYVVVANGTGGVYVSIAGFSITNQ